MPVIMSSARPSAPISQATPSRTAVSSTTAQADIAIACDLFCAVIDNFGDIGVCWRLARQLTSEHGWQVRIFVDDLHAFQKLCPALALDRSRQAVSGIVIEHWHEPAHAGDTLEVADVVIEAFGCELPHVYVAAMARRERAPVWLNLEYLSAEDWVADFHLRQSPHPRYPLTKTFFFPGLGAGTGGVLKEHHLDTARAAFEASPQAREAWWRQATGQPAPDSTVISLFSYENPAVDSLLEQWRDSPDPIVLLVPEGRISAALARFFGVPSFAAGSHAERGNLRAHALAFTDQPGYDALLWASHFNFVRGEDSFVRAQWAARPFVWHIYPQSDDAHLPKLDAALAHYADGLPAAARAALARFWHAWNGVGKPDWAEFQRHRAVFERRAAQWALELAALGDLAGNLAEFAKSQLK
jgi:uncharacterized repeat protein (TIGR03837 family)